MSVEAHVPPRPIKPPLLFPPHLHLAANGRVVRLFQTSSQCITTLHFFDLLAEVRSTHPTSQPGYLPHALPLISASKKACGRYGFFHTAQWDFEKPLRSSEILSLRSLPPLRIARMTYLKGTCVTRLRFVMLMPSSSGAATTVLQILREYGEHQEALLICYTMVNTEGPDIYFLTDCLK